MKTGYSLSNQFSPSFLFNLYQINNNGEMGHAMETIKEIGCAKLADFPYVNGDYQILPDISVWKKALNYRTGDWHWFYIGDTLAPTSPGGNPVPVPGYLGINTARQLLADGQPVMIAFTLTDSYGSTMQTDNWVYSYALAGNSPFTGGHAVCIVGYNDTIKTRDGMGAFRVINSWGADKFDSGYAWITYQMLANKNYTEWFYTFTPRPAGYKPKLILEFETKNFGNFLIQTADLNIDGHTSSQGIWGYRGGISNQTFLTHSVVDLTDLLADSVDLNRGATLSLSGIWMPPSQWTGNPVIKSIHIIDTLRNIDTVINANLTITPDQLVNIYSFYHWDGYARWSFTTSITETTPPSVPVKYELSQNYPNPFNPTTTINFSLSKSDKVTLKVYNLLGQEVALLINKEISAGQHQVKFDASHLPSGVYIYRIESGSFNSVKKMILLK
ncbi:MAG: T9SS type A sorting domain-containing protein [Ignavibacteriaceae bacterium]